MQLNQMGISSAPTNNSDATEEKRQEATDDDNEKEIRIHKSLT